MAGILKAAVALENKIVLPNIELKQPIPNSESFLLQPVKE